VYNRSSIARKGLCNNVLFASRHNFVRCRDISHCSLVVLKLFGNVEEIVAVSTQLCECLNSVLRCETTQQSVGNCFIKHHQAIMDAYAPVHRTCLSFTSYRRHIASLARLCDFGPLFCFFDHVSIYTLTSWLS
jgi:hypothetical protein